MTDTHRQTSQEPGKKLCKIVVQQCESAKLSFDTTDTSVSIKRGMIIFVCFMQEATEESLDHIVEQILNAKLCENEGGGRGGVASFESRFDLLVIPQATLGGKLKGKSLQYHGIIEKTFGSELFERFVDKFKAAMEGRGNVAAGIYGARQILSTETNGPYTHVFEF